MTRSSPEIEALSQRALQFRLGTRRLFEEGKTKGDMWFFELWHFLGDVQDALAAPQPATPAGGEIEALKHDIERHVEIANTYVNDEPAAPQKGWLQPTLNKAAARAAEMPDWMTRQPARSSAGSEDAPELEIQPRGGMTFDWQEQSLIYQRRLRALMKLVAKEGYAVSSDGRTGTPYALSRFRDAAQQPSKDAQINRLRYAILGYFEVFDRCGGSESVSPEAFAAARQGLREALAISSTEGK